MKTLTVLVKAAIGCWMRRLVICSSKEITDDDEPDDKGILSYSYPDNYK